MGSDTDRALQHLEIAVQNMKRQQIPEGGAGLDVAGRMLSCVNALSHMIDAIVAETPATEKGEQYEIGRSQGRNERTYNTAGLLKDAQAALGRDRAETIADLLDHDAVDLAWKWRPLQQYAREIGLSLRVVKGTPVTDSDLGPHVGEVWKQGGEKLVPRKE